ncbi:hypothetical protein Gohar_015584, partial [Gossypium harknessii]|nr:hypothetical protein [Gossypium harknessii]
PTFPNSPPASIVIAKPPPLPSNPPAIQDPTTTPSPVKDSIPTPESFFVPQENITLENEVYTQVFGPDKDGKVLGYERGITKSRLFGYGSITRGSQSTLVISKLIEEMSAKHAKFIDMMDAREKKYRALFNRCMQKGMSSKYKAFHSK